jgi:CRISPR-associated protein Cas8a2/Csx9 subtype I-A
MNASILLQGFPIRGLLRELIAIGLLELAENGIFSCSDSELDERIADAMDKMSEEFEENLSQISSSKIVLNDRNAYFVKTERLVRWYGSRVIPDDYVRLMIYVLKGTSLLLKEKKIKFLDSIQSVNIGKKIILGKEYNGSLAIVPAIIKQAEFYEHQNEFLKPTAGRKPEILLDPIWFALMAIGFLRCFSGYYHGSYYFITKEDVEAILDIPQQVHDVHSAIEAIVSAHKNIRPTPYCEELYELRLSYDVASGERVIPSEIFPLKMYEISFIGNAYTCTKTILINLAESVEYFIAYINYLREIYKISFAIKIKDFQYDNPLHALLELAEREIYERVEGDNSLLLLTFIKDLYRAIHTGRSELVEETIFRLLRGSHSILTSNERVDSLLKKTLKSFMHEQHIKALISAGKR